jgi:hypothetical protein
MGTTCSAAASTLLLLLPGDQLQAALTNLAAWRAVAGSRLYPSYTHLLVFIAENDQAAQQAAGLAAACGYQR